MSPSPTLHAGFERLIGTAATDTTFSSALLRDPRSTALQFGITAADAEIVADIHAPDLRSFATALLPRLYGNATGRVRYAGAIAG